MALIYSPRVRNERIVVLSRVALAAFALLAVWLDPFEPQQAGILTNKILVLYVGYAVLLAALFWTFPLHVKKIGFISHIVDVILFTALVAITQGATSPFFTYFIFALFCAALRWQKKGILWTTLAFLSLFTAISVLLEIIYDSSNFELNRFIIRNVHLATIALLLVYLTGYETRVRDELAKLTDWPYRTDSVNEPKRFIKDMLCYAAEAMDAPRTLMVWEEKEEPVRHIAYLSADELVWQQVSPDAFEPLVATQLHNSHFLCSNAADSEAKVLHTLVKGAAYCFGSPLHSELTRYYDIHRVIGLYLNGQEFQGWLLFLDKAAMIPDDLTLGVLVAQQVTALMDQLLVHARLRRAAVNEERIKMARNLHDGLLQTLTGIALQIETLKRVRENDTAAAQQRLDELQHVIIEEQRQLRGFIRKLKPTALYRNDSGLNLDERLKHLAGTIHQQWGVEVALALPSSNISLPQWLLEELYNLVRESLINCARHAQATQAHAAISIATDRININIADNGCGFPFQGYYDSNALAMMLLGPKSLMERVNTLHGHLSLNSSPTGTTLEMSIPLRPDTNQSNSVAHTDDEH